MKIALLTRNPKLYSHQRIIETAIGRGHEIVPVDYLRCYMTVASRNPELRYMGEKLEGFAANPSKNGVLILEPAQQSADHRMRLPASQVIKVASAILASVMGGAAPMSNWLAECSTISATRLPNGK